MNGARKQAGIIILISGQINFKLKLIRREKEGHFIQVEGIANQEDITILNTGAPKSGHPVS